LTRFVGPVLYVDVVFCEINMMICLPVTIFTLFHGFCHFSVIVFACSLFRFHSVKVLLLLYALYSFITLWLA